uniref:Uncharacterized protein n=1 Tax=Chromera velia CCMP2878 TaxID=1169474 RepID=A0A0G4HPY3_9ALVE|eukprot:Cvel_30100.t1-p1 / transcript=Cvel_30100.t1 / gene=Cvel_30100 / organism=Chromera_velia_CCMP2878 / gene_product=Heat shock protein STI1, putative / transcript_product=Heat shock protein STI1, putative / location=Cvel_scaffold4242:1331-9039(-) / protein_length=1307 / sequence_SO=supercontig / SO=protein_coding / is_pseudo=false
MAKDTSTTGAGADDTAAVQGCASEEDAAQTAASAAAAKEMEEAKDLRELELRMQETMKLKLGGQTEELQKQLEGLPKDLVEQATAKSRDMGNDAFRQKRFKEALQHYETAYFGTPQSERYKMLSNRSACWLALGETSKALDEAIECIKMNRKWPKGYFRAARALMEMGKPHGAGMFLKKGLEEIEVGGKNESERADLEKFLQQAEKASEHQRAMEKVTVDYKRFERVAHYQNYLELKEAAENAGPEIECAEGVDKEEIERLLTGRPKVTTFEEMPSAEFDPKMVFSEEAAVDLSNPLELRQLETNRRKREEEEEEKQKQKDEGEETGTSKAIEEARKKRMVDQRALEVMASLLHRMSRLTVTPRQLAFLETGVPSRWASAVATALDEQEGECAAHSADTAAGRPGPLLALGVGTGVPVVAAVKRVEEMRKGGRRVAPGPAVIACTHQDLLTDCSCPVAESLRVLLESNDVSGEERIRVIPKRIEIVQPPPEADPHTGAPVDEFDASFADVPERASVLCVDPEMFDQGVLSRRVLHAVRHARKELARVNVRVVPARVEVFASLGSVTSKVVGGLDLSAVDALRWSPGIDRVDLWGEGVNFRSVGGWQKAFEFCLDGPLENLDSDLPLSGKTGLEFVSEGQGLVANALVFAFRLSGQDGAILASSIPSGVLGDSSGGVGEEREEAVWEGQAVQWLDGGGIPVGSGERVQVAVSHNGSQLRGRVLAPRECPPEIRRGTVTKQHLEALTDTETAEALEGALTVELHKRLYELQTATREKLEQTKGGKAELEILTIPPAGLLPFLAARAASAFLKPRTRSKSGPVPACRVVAVEQMKSQLALALSVALANLDQLVESPPVPSASLGDRRRCLANRLTFLECPNLRMLAGKGMRKVIENEIAEIQNAPLEEGADAQAQQQQRQQIVAQAEALLDQTKELDSSPSIVAGLPFDASLLGDAALPLLEHLTRKEGDAQRILPHSGVFLPRRMTLFAAVGRVGPRQASGVDVRCWDSFRVAALGGGSDYSPLRLVVPSSSSSSSSSLRSTGETGVEILSEPVRLFSFNLDARGRVLEAAAEGGECTVTPKVLQEGKANCVFLFCAVSMPAPPPSYDPNRQSMTPSVVASAGVSVLHSAPRLSPSELGEAQKQWGTCLNSLLSEEAEKSHGGEVPHMKALRSRSMRQACLFYEEFEVGKEKPNVVSLTASHDGTKVDVRVVRESRAQTEGGSADASAADQQQQQQVEVKRQKPAESLSTLSASVEGMKAELLQKVFENRDANEQALQAALRIAIDPGRLSAFQIDPTEANSLAHLFFL